MNIFRNLRAALRTHNSAERAEAYLNEATSLVDLEQRYREIDRGRFAKRTTIHL